MNERKELPGGWRRSSWEPVPPGTVIKIHPEAAKVPGVFVSLEQIERLLGGKETK